MRVKQTRSNWALAALVLTVLSLGVGGAFVFKNQLKQARAAAPRASLQPGTKQSRVLVYSALLLGPALLLLAVFAYYPVGRGLIMAFQEYSLLGNSAFVGLQNFSEGLFASRFWIAAFNTILFVAINLGLGFLLPFLLAVLVSELPIGTALFRTVYFLPAVTAGLVVSLLWVRLYEPSEFGLLNQLVEPVFHAWNTAVPSSWQADWPVKWLQDPKWAMLAVIIPTIWASTGPGSLIYLAALKGIPEEMYEAADLDGCSPWRKFLNITFPAIFPLLLINFIGAFIGTFQSMGQIFVMTGGGPNYATHVLALEIWQNAFLYLRFGVATAQAWILAATLIGAVVLQLRILEKMDWRRVGT